MHKLLFVLLLALTTEFSFAEYDFNLNCRKACEEIFALKFSEAKVRIADEKKKNPDNLIPLLLENQIDFYRAFIGEREEDFDILIKNSGERLKILEKQGETSSPYHNYLLSEMVIHMAFLNAKHKHFISAAFQVRKAYRLLTKNAEMHPDFAMTYKNLGFLHAAIGSVPDKYQWLVKLVGMEGYTSQGVAEIRIALKAAEDKPEYREFKNEILGILLSVLQRLEFNIPEADKLISKFDLDQNNVMVNFFVIDYYMNTNRNDLAGAILDKTYQSPDQYPLHFLDYLRGSHLLFKLNPEAADYYQRFIDNFTGFNFIKSAYQRIAWSHLLEGNIEAYHATLKKSNMRGETFMDEDKIAGLGAENGEMFNLSLLKARLLFDGGYYHEALAELRNNNMDDFKTERDKAELSYRFARIFDHLDQDTKAKTYYFLTYEKAKEKPWFFAANSALHLGLLYEREEKFDKSLQYFDKCMALKNHEYENSIEQKARSGINRVNHKIKLNDGISK